jgi:RTX calcium-binding nonapeptide repeat (4 copies)
MSHGRLMRRLSLASAVVGAGLMVAPSGASAASLIGETFTPSVGCASNTTRLQNVSPGDQYSAPTDGVITRWSFQAPATPPQLKFKVGRPAGGDSFTMIGQSELVVPVADVLNSYFVQIPVNAGDIIGLWTATNGFCRRMQDGYRHRSIAGDVQPPTQAVFPTEPQAQLDISALLEPDCDNDGFGDETQDPDISSCAPPPPGTPPGPGIPPPGSPPGTLPVTCRGAQATIVGTEGSDVRTGSQGQDVIVALGGNDTLSGLRGNDLICGGPGKDTLRGGRGKDTLLGQKGKDALKGGGGKDLCKGGKGNDSASKCEVEKSI